MKAKIRGTEIFFDVEGASLVVEDHLIREKPVAFLLHGGPGGDHTSYKPLFSRLADRFQLVYIDHRGQGRSARGDRFSRGEATPTNYTLYNNIEDIEALRKYLGLEQVIVIGGSYGGMVALSYAARYPNAVSYLIAYATVASYEFLAKAQQTLQEIGTPAQIEIAQRLWDGNFRSNDELKTYFELLNPLYSYRTKSVVTKTNGILAYEATNEAFGGFLRSYDIRSELPKIVAPTLVLAGRHDWICAPEFSEEIARLIPAAQLQIFEESGHLLRVDEPDRLIDSIAQFVGDRIPDFSKKSGI
jgi:proline iminopeptidase